MTANYNVTLRSSFNYFYNTICAELPQNPETKNHLRKLLWAEHKKFYVFVNTEIFHYFYRENQSTLLERISQGDDEIYSNFLYHKRTTAYKIIKYKKQRLKYTTSRIDLSTIDSTHTERALPANIIHHQDSQLAKYLINNLPVIAIHDAFLIEAGAAGQLMDLTNQYFKNVIPEKPEYALFILL